MIVFTRVQSSEATGRMVPDANRGTQDTIPIECGVKGLGRFLSAFIALIRREVPR